MLDEILSGLVGGLVGPELQEYFHKRNASKKRVFFITFFTMLSLFLLYGLIFGNITTLRLTDILFFLLLAAGCGILLVVVIVLERWWYIHKQAKKANKLESK